MPLPAGAEGMPGVIVPRKTVSELRKLVDGIDDEIEIALSDTKIRFTFGTVVLTSKLIDGTFPDYERVIPPATTRCWRSTARPSPRRSTACLDHLLGKEPRGEAGGRPKGALTLSANSPENGTAVEELEVDYDGAASRSASIRATCSTSPSRSRARRRSSPWPTRPRRPSCAKPPTAGALYVLMPMRV
jgi:DNA polymerase III subunit beta